jgi:xanthine dehydrogenase YagS FAD-binding subunit
VDVQKETVLGQGEIVTDVLLPPADPALKSSYRKVRARGSWDFALAGVALAIAMKGDRVERARVVLSGVAPIPWRSTGVERAIIGQRLDARTLSRAADAAVAGAEPLAQNGYKVPLVRGVIEEALGAYKP